MYDPRNWRGLEMGGEPWWFRAVFTLAVLLAIVVWAGVLVYLFILVDQRLEGEMTSLFFSFWEGWVQ